MNSFKQSCFLFAGEKSGDLHGSHLLKALRLRLPNYHFCGVGGPFMRQEGLETIIPMEKFAVMGLSDVLKKIISLSQHFFFLASYIMRLNPELVVLIDYPGFNLRLAKTLRKRGFQGKVIQYICPTVWAHGKKRIETMASTLDLLLCIFPFELSYFKTTSLKAHYIGNPLKEYISNYSYQDNWKEKFHIPSNRPLISLFPGSRQGEVERNLLPMLRACSKLQLELPEAYFLLSDATGQASRLFEKWQNTHGLASLKTSLNFVPADYSYEMMRESQAACAKSGTVALELALHHCPAVITYKLSFLNRLFAKYVLQLDLPFYAIPNILLNKSVFPEFIAQNYNPDDLSSALKNLTSATKEREASLASCQELSALLSEKESCGQAAWRIEELLKC